MRRVAGFTLLELVAVLSIFAMVALIGVQVIQASLRSSERLTDISESSGELAVGLALLRQDLNSALGREFTPADGGTEPALKMVPGGFGLSVGGLARLQPNTSGQGRVIWRLDPGTGTLLRQVWTTLTPGRGRPAEVAIIRGVAQFELASFTALNGWRQGFNADPRNIAELPLGLRVRFQQAQAGDLETLVSLR